jgi:type 1 glutamine amidotransferase
MREKKALLFYGGWDGHHPEAFANMVKTRLAEVGLETVLQDDLSCLDDLEGLKAYDVIIPLWTMGSLSKERTDHLLQAVREGAGCAGFHGGMGDAFRGNINYEWMVGGLFLGHPHVGPYEVEVLKDPLTEGLPGSFSYISEQYYMAIDPAVKVLMTTPYAWEGATVTMPVAWTRPWGAGKVFYCSLGHDPKEFEDHPEVLDFICRGISWAAR